MLVKTTGIAGTLESSDCMITVEPSSKSGIEIEIESSVKRQFGKQILETVKKTAVEMQVDNVFIKVLDKGALDYALIARTKAAIHRACENNNYKF